MMALRAGIPDMHVANPFHDVQQRRLFDAPSAKPDPVTPQSALDDVIDRRGGPGGDFGIDQVTMPHDLDP